MVNIVYITDMGDSILDNKHTRAVSGRLKHPFSFFPCLNHGLHLQWRAHH